MKAGEIVAVRDENGYFSTFFELVPVETRVCAACGAAFPVEHQRELYCSDRCSDRVRKRRWRLRRSLGIEPQPRASSETPETPERDTGPTM